MASLVVVYGVKNQFNYDIEQIKIDYEHKTYQLGMFTKLGKGDYISKKELKQKVEELKLLGFTRVE